MSKPSSLPLDALDNEVKTAIAHSSSTSSSIARPKFTRTVRFLHELIHNRLKDANPQHHFVLLRRNAAVSAAIAPFPSAIRILEQAGFTLTNNGDEMECVRVPSNVDEILKKLRTHMRHKDLVHLNLAPPPTTTTTTTSSASSSSASSSSSSSMPAQKKRRTDTASSLKTDRDAFRLSDVPLAKPPAATTTPVTFSDMVYGDVQELFIFNYVLDIVWLKQQLHHLIERKCPVTIIHGTKGSHRRTHEQMLALLPGDWWKLYYPQMRGAFSCHHTKMMIVRYRTGVRIVIHTNNVVEKDWRFKTQGVWCQDFPYKPTPTTPASSFEDDLLHYLAFYSNQQSCERVSFHFLRAYDFRAARVVLVPSLPLTYDGAEQHRMSHLKIRRWLRDEPLDAEAFDTNDSHVVMQVSSLGALTEEFVDDLRTSFNGGKRVGGGRMEMKLVWPTVEDVRQSLDGYDAGWSLPCNASSVKSFLHFYRWDARLMNRQLSMPHIKTYTRPSTHKDWQGRLAWVVLTSSNLSTGAWGKQTDKHQKLSLQNCELGMLFVPSKYMRITSAEHTLFSCTDQPSFQPPLVSPQCTEVRFITSTSGLMDEAKPPEPTVEYFTFPLPHSVYPPPYNPKTDVQWTWNQLHDKPDVKGNIFVGHRK